MTGLELLSPARSADIGIAAIDCGADAVYIGGPQFGARRDAGNTIEDIAKLCSYAHRFGARVFVTVNNLLRDDELDEVHRQMLSEQEAGVDAFIIRDMRICSWSDITVPLHASTQCAIRDLDTARRYAMAGCSRIVLERELPLSAIREICAGVDCEVEAFVHGALCVCYSGECLLSETIDGRSADRGECIQACRSMYDLADGSGKVLVRNKALLSLKDLSLHARLAELADAGVCSFKIEGRLKGESYVRNITRYYSEGLDAIVAASGGSYCRTSFGELSGGIAPDPSKTFNRGYTELYFDGVRRRGWSSMDAPKSMGEFIGTVTGIRRAGRDSIELTLKPAGNAVLRNGDGFAFPGKEGVVGFRGDICEGNRIVCKDNAQIHKGMSLYRNTDTAFGKALEAKPCRRHIRVSLSVHIHGEWDIAITARTEDGRELSSNFKADLEKAENRERAEAMLREQLGKRSGDYSFSVSEIKVSTKGGALPLLSASTINSIRRLVAEDLESLPLKSIPMQNSQRGAAGVENFRERPATLMRSKYCIRFELELCPVHQGAKDTGPLYLLNNGRRFRLDFHCDSCEMTLS